MSTSSRKIVEFEVLNGPDDDRLVDAFKYRHDPDADVLVEFTLRRVEPRLRGTLLTVTERPVIEGLHYESGIRGVFMVLVRVSGFEAKWVYYDSRSRKGNWSLELS